MGASDPVIVPVSICSKAYYHFNSIIVFLSEEMLCQYGVFLVLNCNYSYQTDYLASTYCVSDTTLGAWETPWNKTDIFPAVLASEIIHVHPVVQETRWYYDSSRILCSASCKPLRHW